MIVWYQSVSCCSQRLLLWFISYLASLTPICVYSLDIIVQTSEYYQETFKVSPLYYLDALRAQGPRVALMDSTLENAGVELCCTITGARQNSLGHKSHGQVLFFV